MSPVDHLLHLLPVEKTNRNNLIRFTKIDNDINLLTGYNQISYCMYKWLSASSRSIHVTCWSFSDSETLHFVKCQVRWAVNCNIILLVLKRCFRFHWLTYLLSSCSVFSRFTIKTFVTLKRTMNFINNFVQMCKTSSYCIGYGSFFQSIVKEKAHMYTRGFPHTVTDRIEYTFEKVSYLQGFSFLLH